jgi:hypothetical protein
VFENIDANPAANYASLDGVFTYQTTDPRQARFSDVAWGQPLRSGSGAWADLRSTVPIMQLNYANGVTAGLGYIETWVRSARTITAAARVREAFTVSGPDRSIDEVGIRLMRLGGTSPLSLSLETAAGSVIATATIPASQIDVGVPGDHGGGGHATWETASFGPSRTLASGAAYQLVISTAADTMYSIFVIRQGSRYGFSPSTYFADGHAQYTSGGSWGPFSQDGGGPLDEADLQFYLGPSAPEATSSP